MPMRKDAVDLGVVNTLLVLADHGAEPADDHRYEGGEAEQHDPETDGAVQPVGHADHQEQPDGTDDRPVTAVRDVVVIGSACAMALLGFLFRSRRTVSRCMRVMVSMYSAAPGQDDEAASAALLVRRERLAREAEAFEFAKMFRRRPGATLGTACAERLRPSGSGQRSRRYNRPGCTSMWQASGGEKFQGAYSASARRTRRERCELHRPCVTAARHRSPRRRSR